MPPFETGALRRWTSRVLRRAGYRLLNLQKTYESDGLHTPHQPRFLEEPRFQSAYRRAVQANQNADPQTQWRTHIAIWAATVAAQVPGDFVECGVNAGFLSTAILSYLDWNALAKRFFLIDTFEGPDVSQLSIAEIETGRLAVIEDAISRRAYVTDLSRVRQNYAEWTGIEIVKGRVPEILSSIQTNRVAFLHLDMNCVLPEIAALKHFWPSLTSGGVVLCDDYAYFDCRSQGDALDQAAAALGVKIVSLPTGQGIIIK